LGESSCEAINEAINEARDRRACLPRVVARS
jgi:hypothetical protein